MAVFTTRLNLAKPAGGSSGTIPGDDQADIDVLNDNADKIDAAMGFAPVASSGKPATPFSGQPIALTDANNIGQLRVGANWVNPGFVGFGTTAQRDAYYPTPGNAAARVALAATAPRWFNTEKGYEQQYFAQFDDAGAGIFSKAVFGWYPSNTSGSVLLSAFTATKVGAPGTLTKKGAMVEFAGVEGLTIDGVFSADFPRYEMRLTTVDFSTGGQIIAQLRVGGVTDATANYAYSYREAAGGADVGVGPVTTMIVAQGFDGTNVSTHEIVDPFDAARRTLMMVLGAFNSDTKSRFGGSQYNAAKSFDGIYLDTDSTNTMHGNLRFYGIAG